MNAPDTSVTFALHQRWLSELLAVHAPPCATLTLQMSILQKFFYDRDRLIALQLRGLALARKTHKPTFVAD